MKTKKSLFTQAALKLKRRIFWTVFIQVIIIIVAFGVVTWLFFSEVDTGGGSTFWSEFTIGNVWKYILFLAISTFTYLVCGKFLSNKIGNLRHKLNIHLTNPQWIKKRSY